MFVYENPHPQGKLVSDCVKRALTIVTGRDYDIIKRELNRLKKTTGAKAFNDNKNWKYFVNNIMHYEKLSFPAEKGKPRMNGKTFCEQFPKGVYLLRMAHHLSACVNGVICDTWDCSDKCVYNAWKVK